jgi:hypothetical protein
MIELTHDDFDPIVAAAMMNEIMADDDKNDPYLESYQDYAPCSSSFGAFNAF